MLGFLLLFPFTFVFASLFTHVVSLFSMDTRTGRCPPNDFIFLRSKLSHGQNVVAVNATWS
jgi:hypothetical protein